MEVREPSYWRVGSMRTCYGGLWSLVLSVIVTRIVSSESIDDPAGRTELSARCMRDAGTCYYINSTTSDHDSADQTCRTRGARLASVQDGTTLAMLAAMLLDEGIGKAWIGATLRGPTADGTVEATCSYKQSNRAGRIKMSNLPCFDTKKYVCISDKAVTGPDTCELLGLETCGGVCVQNMDTGQGDNWFTAKQECQRLGLILPHVNITDHIAGCALVGRQRVGTWVDDTSVTWHWPSGWPMDFMAWLPGEPTSPLATYRCVSLVANSRSFYGWSVAECPQSLPFICEQRLSPLSAGNGRTRNPPSKEDGGPDGSQGRPDPPGPTAPGPSEGRNKGPKNPPQPGLSPNTGLIIGMAVLAAIVVITTTACIVLLCRRRSMRRRRQQSASALEGDTSTRSVISRTDNPNYESLFRKREGGEATPNTYSGEYHELSDHHYMTITEGETDNSQDGQRPAGDQQARKLAALKWSDLSKRQLPPTPESENHKPPPPGNDGDKSPPPDSEDHGPPAVNDEYIVVIPPPADRTTTAPPSDSGGGGTERQTDAPTNSPQSVAPHTSATRPFDRLNSVMSTDNDLYEGAGDNNDLLVDEGAGDSNEGQPGLTSEPGIVNTGSNYIDQE